MTPVSRRAVIAAGPLLAACAAAPETATFDPEALADLADAVVRPALAEEGNPGAAFVAFDARGKVAVRTGVLPIAKQASPSATRRCGQSHRSPRR